MNAPQSLRRPSNWQDFETLCKKLWGEIWHCPEIKKNGRAGQEQHGVDVSGIPLGQTEYYGIQCKGKDEYTFKQFTEKEIDVEIAKAKLFRPALKKLYFATTAVKDAAIEEYMRIKNKEHIENGLFEIHLYSWEDIVDLIDENKETHDWYLNKNSFKLQHSVLVTFQDDSQLLTIHPKFRQEIEYFMDQERYNSLRNSIPTMPAAITAAFKSYSLNPLIISTRQHSISHKTVNYSFVPFQLKILNTGNAPIEEYKLFFEIEESKGFISNTNVVNEGILVNILPISKLKPSLKIDNNKTSGKITPTQNTTLVGEDWYISNEIYLRPLSEKYSIGLSWKLISKDFKDHGTLEIIIEPDIEKNYKETIIEAGEKHRSISGPIEEFIVEE